MIPFAPWRPDQPLREHANGTMNVYPGLTSYLPFPGFASFSSALAERARGAEAFKDTSDTVYIYAGTETNLYEIASTPTEVSRVGSPYATTLENNWEFTKFGNKCIATNFDDTPQIITFGDPNFTDLTTSPPRAKHIATVGNFVVLGYIFDAVDGEVSYRIQWSGFENETQWVPGTNQSDRQDLLGAGGSVRKIIGGDYGIVFQERAIWRMDYEGVPRIFNIREIEPERGAWMSGGVINYGRSTFYIAQDGVYELVDGSYSQPIGSEKVNNFLINDLDANYLNRVSAAVDPKRNVIIWSYPGQGNSGGTPNKALIYNWVTKEFSPADLTIDLIFRGLTISSTLEDLDSFGDLDSLAFSLDSSVWKGGSLTLSGFNTSFEFGFFNGMPLDAVVETPEFGGEFVQYINGVRPYVESNGGTQTVQIITRDDLSSTPVVNAATSITAATRMADVRESARYMRVRVNCTGGFENAHGIDAELQNAGMQ